MHLLHLPATLSALTFAVALPTPASSPSSSPLPLLIWHGLGDTYDADGLHSTGDLAQEVYPGTYVYYIRTDDDSGTDRKNTFFGNLTTQIEQVCEDIHTDPGLNWPDDGTAELRVDALGFSQGGQFLRGLLQRCEGLKVRSLVTFGSQHNGIEQFQHCGTFDFLCKGATALVKGNAWTDYVQNTVVPAQYYRTINQTTGLPTDDYLRASNFIADVNNEREAKNEIYAERIAAVENFAMYVFNDDVTVIPRDSGWFAEVNTTSGATTPLRQRQLYKEDWLGLKKLDEKGGLHFRNASGGHMELDDKVLRKAFGDFFGPEHEKARMSDAWEAVSTKQQDPILRDYPGLPQSGFTSNRVIAHNVDAPPASLWQAWAWYLEDRTIGFVADLRRGWAEARPLSRRPLYAV